MARIGPRPYKQRTRQHVVADQSVNYIERFIIDEGYTTQRLEKDYGYDLLLFTYDDRGFVEPGLAMLQLKAKEALDQTGSNFVFDLDTRDYNLWVSEHYPVFLVLFDAARRRAYWVHIQQYFQQVGSQRPKKETRTVRVHVPKRQTVSRKAVAQMREAKQRIVAELKRESDHE